MRKINLLLASILIIPLTTRAQTGSSGSMSLQQCIDYALQNEPKMQNALYDEQIAKYKVKEVTAMGLPQLNGSIDVKDFIELPTSLIPAEFFGGPPGTFIGLKFGTRYNTTGGLDASQLLFSSDYLVGLQASKTYLELSKKATLRTKIETASAVGKAYYTVLVNQERMKLLDANVERLKKLADDTKALNENGFVEKVDLDRVTVAYNNLLVEKEKVQRLLDLGYTLLKFQMGMDQNATLTLTDKLEDIQFKPDISAEKFDYTKRVEYSLVQTQLDLSMLQWKKDKFSYLPNLAMYGSFSYSAFGNEWRPLDAKTNWYPTALIGVRLGVPIFSSGMRNYRVQQSRLAVLKSQNDLKFIQQTIDLDLNNAKIQLTNASSTLEMQKKNIGLAEDVYKTAKLKYDQGVGSNLEVMTAETALKEAQTNYYSALFDALIAKIDYDKAMGNLVK
ncbi:MAG TPA: TolC family protein [Bacteroidia bacterium]|jgi:outer membrane protein TolC